MLEEGGKRMNEQHLSAQELLIAIKFCKGYNGTTTCERDLKTGEILPGYPDVNNHHIDAVRYATNRIWKRRGQ